MAGVLDIDDPDFDANAFVDDIAKRGEAADEDSVWQKIAESQAAGADAWKGQAKASGQVFDWVKKLPKNLGVAATNAGLAMAGLADDIGGVISGQNLKVKDEKGNVSEAISGRPISTVDAHGNILKAPALPTPLRDPVVRWRDEMTRNNSTDDDITQGIAQFVIPFTAFTKMANVSKAKSFLSAAGRLAGAEAATVGTAFEPHDGRAADLLEIGRQAEGKLGDVLNKVSPDGSLMNAYIGYMTDREDEGEWEGRYKNIVDSLGLSAATAGLLKAAPFSMKVGRYALENTATGPAFGSKAAQGGWVGFHGTPHKVDKFDINKIGTGEGAQTYGHGLYFAENKDVANSYREKLTRPARRDPAASHALDYVEQHKGDERKAYAALVKQADVLDAQGSAVEARAYRKAADIVKAGNAKMRGELINVEIPDEVTAKMIDFDKSMTEQKHVLDKVPAEDRAKLEAYLEEYDQGALEDLTGNQFQQLIGKAIGEDVIAFNPKDGNFDNPRKLAAEYLNGIDIPGVRYLDGGSRKGGLAGNEGTRNLVLFDDQHVKIKGKE
jgi:hypothetical protein